MRRAWREIGGGKSAYHAWAILISAAAAASLAVCGDGNTPLASATSLETPAAPSLATPAYFVAHSGSDSSDGGIHTPWRTLAYAIGQMKPGDTLYVRGGAAPDTNTACGGDGDQGGACWVQPRLSWDGSLGHGTAGHPVTIACHPGETCILEGTTADGLYAGTTIYFVNTRDGNPDQCSWVTLDGLIIDGRRGGPPATTKEAALPNTPFTVENAAGGGSDDTSPSTRLCHDVVVKNSTIRHGYKVACVLLNKAYRFTFLDDEVYECGYYGDFDHGYYINGLEVRIEGGRIHDNIHAVQIQWVGAPYAGNHVIDGVEIDDNGVNSFWGLTVDDAATRRPWGTAALDAVILWPDNGVGGTVTGCSIHDNTSSGHSGGHGIGIGLTDVVPGVTITDNHLWGNKDQSVGACGPSIYVGNRASSPTCSGNDEVPQPGSAR